MLRGYAVPHVRAAEDRARGRLPEGELMQRAARGLAHVVAARVADRRARHVVVLAGPGDNGGDALWAAAILAREGLADDGPVRDGLVVVGVAEHLHPAGRAAVERAGVEVHLVAPDAELPPGVLRVLEHADLVVDGLLGIGGRPGLRGAMAAAAAAVPEGAHVVAVDLPSGADPAGEEPLGTTVRADETVTFGVAKPVHLLPATAAAVGRLTVVDIGLGADLGAAPAVERLEPADVAGLWPVPGARDHKYSRGVVAVVAGSDAYPGAAVLCTTAAVEAGAGMVRYVGPPHATELVLAACPEVVPGAGRVQAAVVGPGVDPQGCDHPDRDDHQVDHVEVALADDVPLVADAGALELLAERVRRGDRPAAPTLLTPHAGELARLLTAVEGADVGREQVEASPLAHARRAAAATGCTVLLKGSVTLVADPDPAVPVRAQADAPAWLATAGAGDVLAGLCGTLLAAGLDPRDAGSLAALVHGVAAHRANPGGPLRALAVARSIPPTVAALLTG